MCFVNRKIDSKHKTILETFKYGKNHYYYSNPPIFNDVSKFMRINLSNLHFYMVTLYLKGSSVVKDIQIKCLRL